MRLLIGRKPEKEILGAALKTNRPELIVIYGRRRIGKTFLIDSVYENHIQFEFSGIHGASLKEQLANFHLTLSYKVPQTTLKKSKKNKRMLAAYDYRYREKIMGLS